VSKSDRIEPALRRDSFLSEPNLSYSCAVPILTDQERCGTIIGGVYRLESILGRGGMGVVFRARDEETLRPVAVKILRPELAMQHATFAKRFLREAKAAAAIKHPNVVEVYDVGTEADGTAFQVLALLEGESLREHLSRKGTLSLALTLEILLPVMHALEAAHAAAVVHRDLKPDNIFLARQPNGDVLPTLLDFGIAKLLEGHESFATNTGSILGTPSYMAPEQATGARVQGLGIDVWAMGIIVYECLSGAPPFTGASPPHVMLRIMTEDPRPLSEFVEGVPDAVADVLSHALRRSLDTRFSSMREFREALRSAANDSKIAIPEEGRVSTATVMSIAPPPSRDAIDFSVVLDSEDQPPSRMRASADAATVVATGQSRAQALPVPVNAMASSSESATSRPPTQRNPLVAAGVGALVVLALGAAAWFARSSDPPRPPETLVVAQPAVPPTQQVVPEELTELVAELVAEPVADPAPTEGTSEATPARPRVRPRREVAVTPVESEPVRPRDSEREPTSMQADRPGLPGVVAW